MKNKWVVAVLNFLTLGLGTLLVGKRVGLGLAMLVAGSLLRYEEVRMGPALTGVLTVHWVIATTGMTLWGLAMAVEGYREAGS